VEWYLKASTISELVRNESVVTYLKVMFLTFIWEGEEDFGEAVTLAGKPAELAVMLASSEIPGRVSLLRQ
jgi:hypothetical protein